MTYLDILLGLLKLAGLISTWANEERLKDEGAADAFLRVLTRALDLVDAAKAARAGVAAGAATGGLRDDDGHRRD